MKVSLKIYPDHIQATIYVQLTQGSAYLYISNLNHM